MNGQAYFWVWLYSLRNGEIGPILRAGDIGEAADYIRGRQPYYNHAMSPSLFITKFDSTYAEEYTSYIPQPQIK